MKVGERPCQPFKVSDVPGHHHNLPLPLVTMPTEIFMANQNSNECRRYNDILDINGSGIERC